MNDSWLGAEPQIADSQISRELETEMLVVGGGLGGLFAAASGAELGTKTLLIEKHPGLAKVKDELGAIGSRLQKEAGSEIDKWELLRDAAMYSAGDLDLRLWLTWAEESGETIDWWEQRITERGETLWHQAGYETHPADGFAYNKYLTGHRIKWNKLSGSGILRDYAVKHGAQFLMNTGMLKLEHSGGRVTGVIAQDGKSGEYLRIRASRGVVVATGGYAKNLPMMEALQPGTRDIICKIVCDGVGMGDGIRACIWAGARFDDVHTSIVFDRGVLRPDETPRTCALDGVTMELNAQPWLKVNLEGKRFMNESVPYDFILHAARMQPGGCYIVVFDSNFERDSAHFDMAGCSRMIPFPNGAPTSHTIEEMKVKLEKYTEEGRYARADSIEDLARKMELPVENLVASVKRYNELCAIGRDDDFGKLSHHLAPIATPPFYAARTCGFLLATVDGIRIDTNMNALDQDLRPIPGLYVVGNDSGGFFAHTYFNFVTGCAGGRTATFGRRAARIISAL